MGDEQGPLVMAAVVKEKKCGCGQGCDGQSWTWERNAASSQGDSKSSWSKGK